MLRATFWSRAAIPHAEPKPHAEPQRARRPDGCRRRRRHGHAQQAVEAQRVGHAHAGGDRRSAAGLELGSARTCGGHDRGRRPRLLGRPGPRRDREIPIRQRWRQVVPVMARLLQFHPRSGQAMPGGAEWRSCRIGLPGRHAHRCTHRPSGCAHGSGRDQLRNSECHRPHADAAANRPQLAPSSSRSPAA